MVLDCDAVVEDVLCYPQATGTESKPKVIISSLCVFWGGGVWLSYMLMWQHDVSLSGQLKKKFAQIKNFYVITEGWPTTPLEPLPTEIK
jgi:hypothetical protein